MKVPKLPDPSYWRTLISITALLLCLLQPASAYKAEPGNRAANFSGFDIVNREAVQLEDYFGQWVFVEFWATW